MKKFDDTFLPIGNKFWDSKIFILIIKKAIPGIISSMVLSIVPLIDNIFAGYLGDEAIAAVNYSFVIQILFLVIIFGVHGAASVIFAQYYGAKEMDKVRSAHKLKILFSIGFWAFSLFPMVVFPHALLNMFTSDPTIIKLGVEYTRWMGIGLLFYWIAQAYASSILQMGFALFTLIGTIPSILLNGSLDYYFTRVLDWSVSGLAFATIISSIITVIIYDVFVRVKKLVISINWLSLLSIHKKVLLKIIHRWHMMIVELSFGIGILVVNIIIARSYNNYNGQTYGVINGMFGIFTRIATASFAGLYGAVAYFCGKYLGANKFDEAYRNAKRIYIVAGMFGIIFSSIISICAPYYINGFFHNISQINKDQTIMVLRLYSLVFPSFLLGVLSFRILESGGQTKAVMIFDAFHTWVLIVFVGYIIFYIWNPPQYWMAWFIASSCRYVRAIISTFLVQQKLWLVNLVEEKSKEPTGPTFIILAISTFGFYPVVQYLQKRSKK